MANLYNESNAAVFYDNRYMADYMSDWEQQKKQTILNLIKELNLPPRGKAIDFGCGNGVLTDIIRQALPEWEIFGIDISQVAVETAKKRYPECTFFTLDSPEYENIKFDFLFTHHVLEHVSSLEKTWERFELIMNKDAHMLHILPCGNEGSYEYKLCLLKNDGIQESKGNVYFFEDEGHIRRLKSAELSEIAGKYGFSIAKEYYANQFYGAVEWITASGTAFVTKLTSVESAKSFMAVAKLLLLKTYLWPLAAIRQIKVRLEGPKGLKLRRMPIISFIAAPSYWTLKFIDDKLRNLSSSEWSNKKTQKNGSAMFLYFVRS